jgi:hypothetical protein
MRSAHMDGPRERYGAHPPIAGLRRSSSTRHHRAGHRSGHIAHMVTRAIQYGDFGLKRDHTTLLVLGIGPPERT